MRVNVQGERTATTIRPNPIAVARTNGTAISRSPRTRRRAPMTAQHAVTATSARMIESFETRTHLSGLTDRLRFGSDPYGRNGTNY
jgi:hypothetical protein